MSKEKLEIPEEMKQLMTDWRINIECRDVAINSIFRAKRAIYYGRCAYKANKEFWVLARKLYPQIETEIWEYDAISETLSKAT